MHQSTSDAYRELIEIGIALSAESDPARLHERILMEAKAFTNADAGTLYLKHQGKELRFQIVRNDSLGIAMGGTTGVECDLPPVQLITAAGEPQREERGFVLRDQRRDREPRRCLLPLLSRFLRHAGVRPPARLPVAVVPDRAAEEPRWRGHRRSAADQREGRGRQRRADSFIGVIAAAIDTKSPYTGGHCQRVPVITEMLVRAACNAKEGPFAGFDLTEEEWYELRVACWLHDCGKVITPEHIVDKATKLECIYDRIHEIRMRFEVLKRDAEIAMLKGLLAGGDAAALRAAYDAQCAALDEEFAFVGDCNAGGEFMAPEKIERLKQIAERSWMRTLANRIGTSYAERKRRDAIPERPLPTSARAKACGCPRKATGGHST